MQTDIHIAKLTVQETLDFSARCLGTGNLEGDWLACLTADSQAMATPLCTAVSLSYQVDVLAQAASVYAPALLLF